jgi:excisionase family DNA binding protein
MSWYALMVAFTLACNTRLADVKTSALMMSGGWMQAEITREWVTYKQAEELSGLSRTTLWKLLSAGEIKAARVGRAVRINRRSIDEYLERASEGS